MIQVEGYKAFRGIMRITPVNPEFPQREIYGNWLYKPEHNCWYGHGQSFVAEICEIAEDETQKCSMPDEPQISGCISCPIQKCDAVYRSSRCSAYRARVGANFDPKTNCERLPNLNQDELRTLLIDYFYQWAGCEDSYIYDLNRVKEAFSVGTMSLDDFVPWDEERVTELVDDLMAWLKEPADKN